MRARRWTTFVLGVLLLAVPAYAYLPANIEGVVKSWMNSAGQLVRLSFAPTTPQISAANRCDVYMNRTTGDLESSCAGRAATVIASASTLGCSVDSGGNMLCNSFTSADQNNLASPAANRQRLYDNDVNLTPDPSCSAYGLAGVETLIDLDESATDLWGVCDGTTLADYLNPFFRAVSPYGVSTGGSGTSLPADENCLCWLMPMPDPMRSMEKATIRVGGADADDTLEIGVFSFDGQTELFEARPTISSIAVVTATNDLTGPAMPRGDYWLCLGANVVTAQAESIDAAGGGALRRGLSFTLAGGCPAGEMPSTINTAGAAWGTSIVPSIIFSDE